MEINDKFVKSSCEITLDVDLNCRESENRSQSLANFAPWNSAVASFVEPFLTSFSAGQGNSILAMRKTISALR